MNHTHASADFIVVVSNEDDHHAGYHHFAEKVNRKLKAGYELHGQPFCMNHILCQAMIRHAGPNHGNDTAFIQKSATVF